MNVYNYFVLHFFDNLKCSTQMHELNKLYWQHSLTRHKGFMHSVGTFKKIF